MSDIYLDKEDTAFVYDSVTGNIFRLDGDKRVLVTDGESRAKIRMRSREVSKEYAERLARIPFHTPEEDQRSILSGTGRSWSQENYIKAYLFAAKAHNGQLVPGTELPYIMHISFVSMEVIACMEIERQYNGDLAVQCALLHDVIEDAKKTYEDVENAFGKEVAKGVLGLNKKKKSGLAKEYPMQDSLRRIRQEPAEVWLVKLADRITNLAPPPSHWGKEKIKRYREEAIEIHKTLNEASKYLGKRLAMKIEEYANYL